MSTKPINLKNCPVCGRRIRAWDKTSYEDRGGQWWCVEHRPEERQQERESR